MGTPVTPFGRTAEGAEVRRIALGDDRFGVALLTLGSVLQDVRLDGRGLTAGGTEAADYGDGPLGYFGSIVGPVANRVGAARAPLDGRWLSFEPNAAGGHWLHSGQAGLHRKLWEIVEAGSSRAVLETGAADGEGGLPGNRRWRAVWEVGPGAALTLTLEGRTDAPTLMTLANHSYWTLGAGGVDGLRLVLDAAEVLEADTTVLPTGRVLPVAGTRFDLRAGRVLGPQDRLDTCYCLGRARGPTRRVARLAAADGTWMELETTEPGLQVYTADGFRGAGFAPRFGIAMEPQFWPDAPNRPEFPSIRVAPGETWRQTTRWRFGVAPPGGGAQSPIS